MADVISGICTPVVLCIAIVIFVVWFVVAPTEMRFTMVLVNFVTVLIKGGKSPEITHKLQAIILEKTGTIVVARPALTDAIVTHPRPSERKLLRLVASAERGSKHPLGEAIVKARCIR